ncbi:Fe(3+)-hydroxamate ABC transporter permease FhuB [Endobacterium cereale]|nr:Fe(3+)-hydroxamate ABC transporter permease FhuB [Endobacterium cereale]MEB2847188.1 Fe(3+)-hydroxamate ABC transporter permease FhuB [Endobacterium cereale]
MRRNGRYLALLALLAVPSALLSIHAALALLPLHDWPTALLQTDLHDPAQLLARHSFLPQLAVALVAGAALSLSGVLLQQSLKNPIAEPTTLGTSAGAGLALTIATIFAPWMLEYGRELISLFGATVATASVLMIAGRGRLSVSVILLAGMIVSMTASATTAIFLSLFTDYMGELFVWQSGSLVQNGDRSAIILMFWFVPAACLTVLLRRPFSMLGLEDEAASSLGLKPWVFRLIAISLAISLGASVAAAVGVIAFVGLAASAFAKATGARSFGQVAGRATIIGALLLLLVDRLSDAVFPGELPAGSLTALIGAPLLFLLIRRLPGEFRHRSTVNSRKHPAGVATFLGACVVIITLSMISLAVGPTAGGWSTGAVSLAWDTLEYRWPRVLGAASAGILLALAGGTMQKITANPLAAPEALGVSGGATIGVLALLTVTGGIDQFHLALAAALGAVGAGLLVNVLTRNDSFAADRLLLCGLTVTMLATGWASVFLATGDPRTGWVMSWLSGSTYRLAPHQAMFASVISLAAFAVIPFAERWLTILPLGKTVASSVGVPVSAAWGVSFAFAAIATGAATLLIGPLSFIGLTAPHLARLLGFHDTRCQMFAAAWIGAAIMILADWLGRIVVFPWETPAGIFAALLGGPYMLWALRRR